MERKFENSLTELEKIVRELENGELSLEEAISKYQRGLELSKFCHEELKRAEKVIVNIIENDKEVKFDF